ncbi:hypothetical protein NKR23_g11214 [Pleurostoma richardsiae]|uniref:Alpha/beta hydrolase fold-3 domain-containing protein n=1 Tax=Pleurostoma richardsiae TaxID=41990 RepID=A0AA38R404_9PEZI|nr:hypothetical protein NKR23_g11214 [Pleurostoma richardsiae]
MAANSTSQPQEDLFTGAEKLGKMFAALEQQGVAALGPVADTLEEYYVKVPLTLPGTDEKWESSMKVIKPRAFSPSKVGKWDASSGEQRSHPLIVLFHGGGFTHGSPESMTRPGREFAEAFGAVAVIPTYRMVRQDVRWPTPQRSAWSVLVYLSENAAQEFGVTLDEDGHGGGFIVNGFSAGANLTAVTAAISVFGDTGDPAEMEHKPLAKPVTGVALTCPSLMTDAMVPEEYRHLYTSLKENYNAPGLTGAMVETSRLRLQANSLSRWYSPVNALTSIPKTTDFGVYEPRFPPCYIQVCGLDPMRDDGVIFGKMLADRGFEMKIDVFSEDAHNAWMAMPFPTKSQNPSLGEGMMAGMEWLLKHYGQL